MLILQLNLVWTSEIQFDRYIYYAQLVKCHCWCIHYNRLLWGSVGYGKKLCLSNIVNLGQAPGLLSHYSQFSSHALSTLCYPNGKINNNTLYTHAMLQWACMQLWYISIHFGLVINCISIMQDSHKSKLPPFLRGRISKVLMDIFLVLSPWPLVTPHITYLPTGGNHPLLLFGRGNHGNAAHTFIDIPLFL